VPIVIPASQAVIDELWDFDQPTLSEERFRQASGSATHPTAGLALRTQLARALGLQQRFDEAAALLDDIAAAAAQLPLDGRAELQVRVALERGRLANSGGNADAARPHFVEARERAAAVGLESLAIDALHMLAIIAPLGEQAELHERAIVLADSATDPHARDWLASLLNNYGWTRFDLEQHEAALALFQQALLERLRQGTPRQIGIARWCVGRTLRALGRVDEALALQRQLKSANDAAGIDDHYVDEEIAACLAELGERTLEQDDT
jgi:tetratricopeptide (TPR) repeat protein